jgi:hypothetical protein
LPPRGVKEISMTDSNAIRTAEQAKRPTRSEAQRLREWAEFNEHLAGKYAEHAITHLECTKKLNPEWIGAFQKVRQWIDNEIGTSGKSAEGGRDE